MMYFKHFHSWLTAYGGGLGKLAIASWLLTNTMFLLCSPCPVHNPGFCETDIPWELSRHLAWYLLLPHHSLADIVRHRKNTFIPDTQYGHVPCSPDD